MNEGVASAQSVAVQPAVPILDRQLHALSEKTLRDLTTAKKLKSQETPSQLPLAPDSDQAVFDALAMAKVATSQVAMHLRKDWREEIFSQLDALHDTSEWEEGDAPVIQTSFTTFLRAIIRLQIKILPSLGLSSEGNLLGAWVSGTDRLMMEFLPDNKVQWVVSHTVDGDVEPASGICAVRRIAAVLAPYGPEKWLLYEG